MKIHKVPQEDPNLHAYQIQDDGVMQGVFYLEVDRSSSQLSVYCLSPDGQRDETDAILLAARLGFEGATESEGGYVWPYEDDTRLSEMIFELIGTHAETLYGDLGIQNSVDPADWEAALTGPDVGQSVQTPGMVDVGDYSFTFDPSVSMSEPEGATADTGGTIDGAEVGGDEELDPAELAPDDEVPAR